MGDDYERPATDAEIGRMRALVRQALDEGAIGMSAGLEYVPGRWSTTEEVARMAEELVPFDGVCPTGALPHRDRQGMGVACVSLGADPAE